MSRTVIMAILPSRVIGDMTSPRGISVSKYTSDPRGASKADVCSKFPGKCRPADLGKTNQVRAILLSV
jgi:hypothetical protein